MTAVTLTLVGKPGCHLCDDARAVVETVMTDAQLSSLDLTLEEQNILEDDALFARYHEEIPVLLIDGKVHNFWRIDPVRLTAALQEKS